jgi:hypothetical protein
LPGARADVRGSNRAQKKAHANHFACAFFWLVLAGGFAPPALVCG